MSGDGTELRSPIADERAAENARLAELVSMIARGDEKGLDELYACTVTRVLGLIARVVGDRAAAEEVALDVFGQVWRQAGRYDGERGSVMTWLLMMARTRAIDAVRARQSRDARLSALSSAPEPVEPSLDPEQQSVRAAEAHRVRRALATLPVEQRTAIEAAFFAGLSHSEIANRLNEPLGTIKTRIRRGMQRTRELLQAEPEMTS